MKNRIKQRKNRKKKNDTFIPKELKACPPHHDCNSCVFGYCTLLEDVNFGERDCPFYKSKTQFQIDFDASIQHLLAIGRRDLIESYHPREAKKLERIKA